MIAKHTGEVACKLTGIMTRWCTACRAQPPYHADPSPWFALAVLSMCTFCFQGAAAVDGAVVDLTDAADSPSPAHRDAGVSEPERTTSAPPDEKGTARVPPAPGMLSLIHSS